MAVPSCSSPGPRPDTPLPGSYKRAIGGTILVVEPEVGRQARFQLRDLVIVFDVDVFVFDTPPQPLHEHVVQRTPPTVTAHRDPGLLQAAGVLPRRELRPLIG